MGEPQKGGTKFEISKWGSKRGEDTIFDSNLVSGKILDETMVLQK